MPSLISTLHEDFFSRLSEISDKLFEREVQLPKDTDKVGVAIGMRRTGKTFALFCEIKRLLKEKYAKEQILYIDFEDDRLQPLSQQSLSQLLDDFYTLFPENHKRHCFLFLDEIQAVPEWSLVIRRFINTKNVKIYLTGSSAKLLSKEIATSMRGRSLSIEMWPYSFTERLEIYNEKLYTLPLSQRQEDSCRKQLEAYLLEGGFPEVVAQPKIRWMRLLQDYVEVVTFRDIIERHNISNSQLIKYLISTLIKNTSTNFSINKFYHDLKSQGFKVGRDTISEYLKYIEDAFLIFTVPLYNESLRKVQANPKKCYCIDTGMVRANQLSLTPNWGRLFENLIYLDLRRKSHKIFYYLTQERYEVDFFTQAIDGSMHLYQVAWDTSNPQTASREERALRAAEKELGVKGEIITRDTYFEWFTSLS